MLSAYWRGGLPRFLGPGVQFGLARLPSLQFILDSPVYELESTSWRASVMESGDG
jgi:hypothetical protein